MSVGRALSIDEELRMRTIYIRLMDEGTDVFRPVSATKISDNVYEIDRSNSYDPVDEVWEFLPRTLVKVESSVLSGLAELVAISLFSKQYCILSLSGSEIEETP